MMLGIESTAHTFGVAVVKNGKILSEIKDSYTTKEGEGGMIPNEVAKHHERIKDQVYDRAIKEAKIKESEIKAIAFSNAPGLAPALLVGMKFAKQLANKLAISLIPVNHCIAHLEITKSVGAEDPVLLYVSGANTQIISYAAGKYRIFGETLDMGVGNMIDTFARYAGLGFPGGPRVAELAEKSETYIELPYSIKGMDISVSGLLTKLKQLYDKKIPIEDLSYSLQETVFAMMIEAAERALAHTGKNELALGGGVCCNRRLQEMCKIMCKERGAKFFCPPNNLLVDNAAMIAYTGEIMFKSTQQNKHDIIKSPNKIDIAPRERTDEISISWR